MKRHFLIGAATSGSGKTTFTTGLLRVLYNKGIKAQPFKCGPDYIDPQFHTQAAHRPSVNLDSWLASMPHLQTVYSKYGTDAEVLVTEGVMGLFDGYNRWLGSSAQLASSLNIPVILLVNARSTAFSVAPLIYGFKHFNPDVRIAGVVFNQVASESHFRYLREACEATETPCFGYLPRLKELEVPSRHLGLTLDQEFERERWIEHVAEAIKASIDIDSLLDHCPADLPEPVEETKPADGTLRVAVARDEAFNFIYRENIASLERLGQVLYFSPLKDHHLPERIDLLYLPGGYPEFFLPALEANRSLKEEIAQFANEGGKVLAECGGMMYLCREIIDPAGGHHPMCGVLPLTATMEGMRLHLGYRQFEYNGHAWRGHEFHYSNIIGDYPSAAALFDAKGKASATPLYRQANVIAGYTHLYWGDQNPLNLWES